MDPILMNQIAQERINSFIKPSKEVKPFYAPFKPQWRKQLANAFYTLASKLAPKRYPQNVQLGQN